MILMLVRRSKNTRERDMEAVLLLLSVICTVVGIAIGDSAKWVNSGGTGRKFLMLVAGFVLILAGMLLFLFAFHLI